MIAESDTRRVVVNTGLAKAQKKVEKKDQASVWHWMKIWVRDQKDAAIPEERFKFQTRWKGPGGENIRVSVFKSYQARYYGFTREVEGKETFLVSAIDPAKKDNQADPAMYKRVGEEALRVMRALGSK